MNASSSRHDGRGAAEARVRRIHLSVVTVACVLAALVCGGVALYAAGDLPATMATHFDASGTADGFTETRLALLLQGLATVGVPLAVLAVFWAGEWWRGEYARSVSAFLVGLAGGLAALFVQLTLAHVGVDDPATVRAGFSMILVVLATLVVVWVLAWLLLPQPLPRLPAEPVVPIAVAPTERVTWFGRARTSHLALVVLSLGTLVVFVAAIAIAIWWLLLVGALMVVLALGITSFAVRVDGNGLTWSSALGFPRGAVPLANITSASVIEVSPGDFGGYGLRGLPGRLGLITRSGRALRVEHERGELVITVDDAATAAGVIEGLRSRG